MKRELESRNLLDNRPVLVALLQNMQKQLELLEEVTLKERLDAKKNMKIWNALLLRNTERASLTHSVEALKRFL
jgi:hypothetical protein